jgi:Arc/MetJ-type ribon-helix-helix transcriptional regulator
MADRMVSLRLDPESEKALAALTEDGKSQSDAIREALLVAARKKRSDALRAEAERLAADPVNRAEMKALMEFMETLRGPW